VTRLRMPHILVLLALARPGVAVPAPAPKDAKVKAPVAPVHQGPLPAGAKAAWTHAPFAAGDCSICHERNDPKNPGQLVKQGNELCFMCHDEFQAILARKHPHSPAKAYCLSCHNAHDSRQTKLLHAEATELCLGCHASVKKTAERSAVKHKALTQGKKCLACHNPHASSVEKLLTQLPFDLCVSCHSADGMKDASGKTLTNFGKWLADNKEWHAPVTAKDCSACHLPHGSAHFRLLVADYPPEFYAAYDEKNYELCFTCHNPEVARNAETTTLTGFRDGPRNLHFVHVNKAERGRTCRACHEVHASKQVHQIRDGVPYGSNGWMLKVGYTKTPNGGSCARTCHDTKSYDRKPEIPAAASTAKK